MSQSVFPGPIAPQNNPEIEPQWFQPSAFTISALSYALVTTVTVLPAFDVDANYVVGQAVRFVIPPEFGAKELNGQQGYVLSILGTNQFTVNINTSQGYSAFIPSPTHSTTLPKILAIGDVNSGPINTSRNNNGTTIAGTFQNISPSAGG